MQLRSSNQQAAAVSTLHCNATSTRTHNGIDNGMGMHMEETKDTEENRLAH